MAPQLCKEEFLNLMNDIDPSAISTARYQPPAAQ